MVVLIVLILLAAVFGIGAVLEGLAWAVLIALALVGLAVWYGYTRVRGRPSGRP